MEEEEVVLGGAPFAAPQYILAAQDFPTTSHPPADDSLSGSLVPSSFSSASSPPSGAFLPPPSNRRMDDIPESADKFSRRQKRPAEQSSEDSVHVVPERYIRLRRVRAERLNLMAVPSTIPEDMMVDGSGGEEIGSEGAESLAVSDRTAMSLNVPSRSSHRRHFSDAKRALDDDHAGRRREHDPWWRGLISRPGGAYVNSSVLSSSMGRQLVIQWGGPFNERARGIISNDR